MTDDREPQTILLKDRLDDLHIATGAYARCYRHPDDPGLCIKIATTDRKAAKRLRTDVSYFEKLHARKEDLSLISDMLGACETDLGSGHLYQCVADADGSVSKTLNHYLSEEPERAPGIITALRQLGRYLEKNRIIFCDFHSKNILIRLDQNEEPTAIIVDGLGDGVAIQILNYFPSHVDTKIARRWNRFIRYIDGKYSDVEVPVESLYIGEKK